MIPVHEPEFCVSDRENVLEALTLGEVSGTAGRFIAEFEEGFAAYCGCRYGVAVSSGSTALHLAAVLGGIERGDEVIMNACTNIACANAIVLQGGIITPIDSDPVTWCLNVRKIERAITPRTKAIMPVHIYGHPCDMDPILELARRYNLFVIEDCAEAHGAEYKGRRVGSFGDVGCFSFYSNKIITTGEGGMIVTNDSKLAARARSLRNLAFGTPRFVHEDVGFNYRMTNLQAAIGVGQLGRIEDVIRRKRQIANWYTERLRDVPGLMLPVEQAYARNVFWMYCVVLEPQFDMTRDDFATQLREHGIDTRTLFCPMNHQPALLRRGAVKPIPCPVAEHLWTHGLYLPSSTTLTEHEIGAICHFIQEMSPTCA